MSGFNRARNLKRSRSGETPLAQWPAVSWPQRQWKSGTVSSGMARKRQSGRLVSQQLVMEGAVDKKTPWEREVRRRPELQDLGDAAIRKFLREADEYQQALEAEGYAPVPLRMLINPLLLPGIPEFVRIVAGPAAAAQLPSEDQITTRAVISDPRIGEEAEDSDSVTEEGSDADEPAREAGGTGEADEGGGATGDADTHKEPDGMVQADILWDELVHEHLETAANLRTLAHRPIEEIESLITSRLRWNQEERFCKVALIQFVADFTVLDTTYGIRARLKDGGETGKRMVKLLTARLEPPEFRDMVQERVMFNNIKAYSKWLDLVTEYAPFYDGMQCIKRRDTRGEGDFRFKTHQHHDKYPSPRQAHAFTANTKRTGDSGTPSTRPPPSPCPHCSGNHWLRDCPTRPPRPAGPRSKPYKGRPGTEKRVAARQVGTHTDGNLILNDHVLSFVVDSGATKTFVSASNAHELLRDSEAQRVNLTTPLTVEVAGEESLNCRFKILAPVTLQFSSGESADIKLLELYAVERMRRGEVLLGRSTLRKLGVDIITLVKSALLARDNSAVGTYTTAAAEDDDLSFTAAARRAHCEPSWTQPGEPSWTQGDVDDRAPDISTHNPVEVAAVVEQRLQHAFEQGLSLVAVKKLREAVSGELADVFRTAFGDDPPARVTPIHVEMTPDVYALRTPAVRRYHTSGSKAMAAIMARLERFGYVYRNNLATIVSPAYPVRKANIDASTPLEDQYRITVDLRAVNACTIPTKFPLPRLETFMDRVAGMTHFGTLDLFGGYWQLPLDKESQKYFSILTDAGIWTPYRLIQGSRNAAGPFQAIVGEALGDILNRGCVQYVDDIMVYAPSEEQFIHNWITVLQRLHNVGLKVSAKKTHFYARSIKYCGRIFTTEGASFDPSLIQSVTKMPSPNTAAELRSYLATTNWLRSSIPRYAETVQPLQDLLTTALATAKTTHTKPMAIRLPEVGWEEHHTDVFRSINAAVGRSVTLAYPDERKVLCVFTDASHSHWAGVVSQVDPSERVKGILDQSHQPLAFVSGSFSGASLRWPTIEKEAFAILETCIRVEHILKRPSGFQLYTDHNNLRYLYSLDPTVFDGRRSAAERVERWSIVLRGFHYDIHHIPGADNILADLLTRWGASTPPPDSALVVTTRSRTRAVQAPAPNPLVSSPDSTVVAVTPPAVIVDLSPSVQPAAQSPDSQVTAADTAAPPVGDPPAIAPQLTLPPDNPSPWAALSRDQLIEFDVDDAPTVASIRRAQAELTDADIAGLDLHRKDINRTQGVLVDAANRVFVPDKYHLRLRLCVVAHQGLGGHRGSDTTTHWLTAKFTWPGIKDDIRVFCSGCLHCLKTKGGRTVPRPWMHIPTAKGPNEVLHFDYVYIRAASDDTTPEYVLVIVDGFSRFVWLSAHRNANAANTVKALMQWFGLFGAVRKWVSDQGRHFLNDVVEQLRYHLGADHRFTTAYAPWSNGIVERVGRSLRETLSALVLETRRSPDTWPTLLPMVNCVINQSPSLAIGGYAPITAFTGRQPTSPMEVVFANDSEAFVTPPLSAAKTTSAIAKLEAALSEVVSVVSEVTARAHPTRPGQVPVDFGIGDYVLVVRRVKGKDKTAPLWGGPGLVIAAENERSFKVRDLLTDKVRVVHAEHIKRYSDSTLNVTPQLKSFIAASAIETRIEAITAHRKNARNWELRVVWEGFEDDDSTWQELKKLYADVPELIRRYVKSLQDSPAKLELTALLTSYRTGRTK
jgi:transposase InsO family protein